MSELSEMADGAGLFDPVEAAANATCRYCNTPGLHWEKHDGGWRLFDSKGMHECQPDGRPVPDCKCTGMTNATCVCGHIERALRAWAYHGYAVPMTPGQREYCLREIDSVEGYRREAYVNAPDRVLASGVLMAWTDYCRDKGLL